MERKTKIHAEADRQELIVTREFELPLELLFKAYTEADILEQWMGTKVIKLENRKHGSYQFETSDARGNIVFKANGTIHDFVPGKRIVRTFEMENTSFDAQLEFLDFTSLSYDSSKLSMQVVYRSAMLRDEHLKMPFEYGINMAHNRLQEVLQSLK